MTVTKNYKYLNTFECVKATSPPPNFRNRYNLLWTQKQHKEKTATTKLGSRYSIWLVESTWHLAHLSYVEDATTSCVHTFLSCSSQRLIPPLFQWHMRLNSWQFFSTKQWKGNCQNPALYCQKGNSFHKMRNWNFQIHTY